MEYKICPKCSSNIEEANRFCGKCGHDYEDSTKIANELDQSNNIVEQKDEPVPFDGNVIVDSSNQSPKRINKVAIISCIVILLVIVIGTVIYQNTKKQKDFDGKFSLVTLSIQANTINCVEVCGTYSTVWRNAIDSRWKDFSTEINKQQDTFRTDGTFKKLDDSKKLIDDLMKDLSSPPDKYKNAHTKLVELYGIYTQIYSQAKSPSGSLVSFNNNINDLQSKFIKTSNELNALTPKEKN